MASPTVELTKTQLEARLSEIVENRFIYQRGLLVDNVEPTVANQIIPAIKESLDKAVKKLRDVDLSEFNRKRYTDYVAWCQKELSSPFVKRTKAVQASLVEAADLQADATADILSFGGQAALISNVGISAAKATAIVQTPVGGATLATWMAKMGSEFADKVQRTTTQAMLEGIPYRQIVKQYLSPTGALANGTRHQAITLARTYVQSVAQQAQDEVIDANKDIIEARRWSSVFDNRTCPTCAPLNGRVYSDDPKEGQYPISMMPSAPIHPRCRCMILPVVTSWMEILGIQDTKEGKKLMKQYEKFQNPEKGFTIREHYKRGDKKGKVKPVNVGGAPIETAGQFKGTFEQWMKAYPVAAKDILGPQRYELWSSGKIKLNDLLDNRNNLRTVAELKLEIAK